ncbi:MAG: UDP-2,3-diacylglucosamine diphosphatase [Bacteroidales bacterium]|nr:UDP-2,3-diacylglucosamine diphosphatase [Bacteroidales bacterium]
MENTKKRYKTIVISDTHIGSKWSKTKEVIDFLENNSCETLILAGDIIDGWSLQRSANYWKQNHTIFLKTLLDIQEKTKIIYIRGNHDDFLDKIVPLNFLNIIIRQDYIYETNGKRFFVLHGDVFDHITKTFGWLSKIGDIGYSILLRINKYYNLRRTQKGLPYYSISKEIKAKTKLSVNYISNFEKHIAEVAQRNNCDGVICGHIHHAEIKQYGNILYLNAGDWIESLSALTEDFKGNWKVINYCEEAIEDENRIYEQILASAI